MARPPKPENLNNPLRQLRTLLSEKEPFTQNRLAEISGIPIDTIRSLEVGRFQLGQATRQKIIEATGARWDDKKRRWLASPDESIPFNFAVYSAYRRFIARPSSDQERKNDLAVLKCKLDLLFEEIPDRFRDSLLHRITACFEECQQDFRLKEHRAFFEGTHPRLMVIKDPETHEIRSVERYYPLEFEMARSARTVKELEQGKKSPPKARSRKQRQCYIIAGSAGRS